MQTLLQMNWSKTRNIPSIKRIVVLCIEIPEMGVISISSITHSISEMNTTNFCGLE